MKYLHHLLDATSIKLFLTTLLGGFVANLSKGDIAIFFTASAGITTVIYNAIRIYKEFKNK